MLRRVLRLLAVLLAILLGGAVLLVVAGPFLIPTAPVAEAPAVPAEVAPRGERLTIAYPGTDGIGIHYLAQPAEPDAPGPPLLLLHGFTFNAYTWLGQLERLDRHGRLVAYDQIPYGRSEKLAPGDWSGASPYTREGAARRLVAVMDALGMERAVLVGNSSGGTLALEAALRHPERVAALVLVAPWVYVQRPTFPRWLADLPQMRRLSLLIARRLGEGGGEGAGLLGLSYADDAAITERRRRQQRVHTATRGWDLAWGALLARSLADPVDVAPRLPRLEPPTLLVTGDQDRLVPAADTERVAERIPGATLRVLPGCGHVPQEECPEAFAEVVGSWLAGRPWESSDAPAPSPPAGGAGAAP